MGTLLFFQANPRHEKLFRILGRVESPVILATGNRLILELREFDSSLPFSGACSLSIIPWYLKVFSWTAQIHQSPHGKLAQKFACKKSTYFSMKKSSIISHSCLFKVFGVFRDDGYVLSLMGGGIAFRKRPMELPYCAAPSAKVNVSSRWKTKKTRNIWKRCPKSQKINGDLTVWRKE